MSNLNRQLRTLINRMFRSLAFLPLPMLLGGIVVGAGLYYVEATTEASKWLSEEMPALAVASENTARTALSLLVGGLITLTVFTFTQIMGLFSQVASSYSPRLLPLLTGSRALQSVMGVYLSVIVINVIVLLGIDTTNGARIPVLSILVCAVFGVGCLIVFIYFIATISNKIQVTRIINLAYDKSLASFEEVERTKNFAVSDNKPDFSNWFAIPAPRDGYLGTVDFHRLSELAKKYDTELRIGVPKGHYVPKYQPLIESREKLSEHQIEDVLAAVAPVSDRYDDWFLPPIRLLTEIAVKAMSPGINDPGTAVDVLDRLTSLLAHLMHLPANNCFQTENGNPVWLRTHTFPEVATAVFQEIRTYSRTDIIVSRKLYQTFYHLLITAGNDQVCITSIKEQIAALIEDNRRHIKNSYDRQLLAREILQHRQKVKEVRKEIHHLRDPKLAEAGYR